MFYSNHVITDIINTNQKPALVNVKVRNYQIAAVMPLWLTDTRYYISRINLLANTISSTSFLITRLASAVKSYNFI